MSGGFWSPRVAALEPYVPGEQPRIEGLVKLNTNECPLPPSPHALAAMREAADDSLRLYPDPESLALREALAIDRDIESIGLLLLGIAMIVGAGIGLWRARVVEMTGMPELIALLHSFVGLAAVLVGWKTRSITLTLVAGMVTVWLAQLIV